MSKGEESVKKREEVRHRGSHVQMEVNKVFIQV